MRPVTASSMGCPPHSVVDDLELDSGHRLGAANGALKREIYPRCAADGIAERLAAFVANLPFQNC